MSEKESLQENQYHFPYHHLTHEKDGAIFTFRHLFWGLEHFTYIQYVIEKVLEEKFTSLIDVGCGEGRIISELASKLSGKSFTGIDVSESAINFAKGFTHSINFHVHDITKEAFSKTFDLAISCEVIEHIKPNQVDSYCKNIATNLIDKGVFILTTPTTNFPVNPKHYQHFTREMLEEYLRPYFLIEEVAYLNRYNFYSKFLDRLLANRFFISNTPILNRWILKQYKKKLLVGTKETGSRIYIKCRKI